MPVLRAKKTVETAIIEIEYLISDVFFVYSAQSIAEDEASQEIRAYYKGACRALEVSLELIRQAEAQQKTVVRGRKSVVCVGNTKTL